jgi:hypothetical protein
MDEKLKTVLTAAKNVVHNFAIVIKGSVVVHLLVSKIPIKDAEVQAAKKQHGGTSVLRGKCQGHEGELVFRVAVEPTIQDKKLKEFITTATTLVVKPRFEVVTDEDVEGGEGGETESESTVGGTAKQEDEKATVSPGTQEPHPTADPEMARFIARLNKLKPEIDAAIAAPHANPDLKLRFSEAAVFARKKDFTQANHFLDQVESLLKPTAPTGDASAQFTSRLKALKPQLDKVLAAGTPAAQEVKHLAGEAAALARQGEFGQANRVLDDLEKRVRQVGAGLPSAGGAALSPQFSKLWEQAKAAWEGALDTVNGQLEKLRIALIDEKDPELKRIAEFGLNAMTADHKVPLQAAILDLDRTPDNAKAKIIGQAKELVTEFRDHIETDERVEVCDDNPFNVKVTIRATLDPALAQMEKALSQAFAA